MHGVHDAIRGQDLLTATFGLGSLTFSPAALGQLIGALATVIVTAITVERWLYERRERKSRRPPI